MIFADLLFLYVFLPALIICYVLAGAADKGICAVTKDKGFFGSINPVKNMVLIVFSLVFYAWGEPFYIRLMLISIGVNYLFGLLITLRKKPSKAFFVLGIIFNIAMIGTFKYGRFISENLNAIGIPVPVPEAVSPVGISFYTFQSISYLADVYKGDVKAQKNPLRVLLYISMFPQLIAGPIVRYETIAEDICSRRITVEDVSEGAFRFFIGLGKKVILANQLSIISEQLLDGEMSGLSVGGAWLGIIAFTFQIYFDFSGYSDMAIGMGRCLGFRFNENFNYPYISRSITEFWRRWHISLSSFFRDYVYIPMGGNRRHQPLNIMTVWLLTGLWHGASWNFVIWGVYFGIIIMIEKYTLLKIENKIPKVFLHIYSLFLIIFGWAIFYFEDLGKLGEFIKIMFGVSGDPAGAVIAKHTFTANLYLLIAAAVCSVPLGALIRKFYGRTVKTSGGAAAMSLLKIAASAGLLWISTLLLVSGTNNPFLYFRF